MRRIQVCGSLLAIAILLSIRARAADCGEPERPWVSVSFQNSSLTQALEERIVADFRAGLSDRQIEVCALAEGPRHAPVALVRIARTGRDTVGIRVEVRDPLTEKHLTRDVDLSRVPEDGRALSLALAADELLRASWLELALRRRRAPKRSPPPEVTRAVEGDLAQARHPSSRASLYANLERFSVGHTQLGVDAALRWMLVQRLHLELALGAREALAKSATHGRVRASAILVGTSLQPVLIETPDFELLPCAGVVVTWTRFRGEAGEGGRDAAFSGLAVVARGGLSAALRVAAPIWLDLGASAGAALRALVATDDQRRVTGLSGFQLGTRVGIGAEF